MNPDDYTIWVRTLVLVGILVLAYLAFDLLRSLIKSFLLLIGVLEDDRDL